MLFETSRFGTVDIPDNRIIGFPAGLPGFPELHRFFIIEHRPGSPFRWLQSGDDKDIAFVIADPSQLLDEYRVSAKLSELEVIEAKEDDEFSTVVMVTIHPNGSSFDVYANLRAPVIVNHRNMQGIQHILLDDKYSMRHKVEKKPSSSATKKKNLRNALELRL